MQNNELEILSFTESLPTLDELIELIEAKQYARLVELSRIIPSADIAAYFENMPNRYYVRFFRLLSKETAAEVFVEMSRELKEHLINAFTDNELSDMLDELYLDDTVDIIEEMPASVVKRIIKNSSRENRYLINQLLRYPKDSAGTIMTTEYVRFTKEMTVQAALDHLRHVAIDKETIYTCYITETNRRLIGLVTARQLLTSPLDTKLSDIMEENVIFVNTTEDREDVALKFNRYGFLAMPVVDNETRLVGIITVDDVIDVIKQETEEDFAKMAAITPTEKTYLKTSPIDFWKARIPWILLLMLTSTFSSAILGKFEAILPAVLVLFVPMLMGTSGNSGGQSSVTVIRSISIGEIQFSDFFRVISKEVIVGVLSGLTLGVVSFLKVIFIDGMLMGNSEITVEIALIIAVTMALTILTAKIIGAMLPLLVKKIGLDPAVMASPFITTLLDVISLLLYFFIATKFL